MRAERKAFLLMAAFGLCPFMREILALSVCALALHAMRKEHNFLVVPPSCPFEKSQMLDRAQGTLFVQHLPL
jgi:hypothetical protein